MNYAIYGGGNEKIAVQFQQLFIGNLLCSRHPHDRSGLSLMLDDARHIQTRLIVDSSPCIADRDHFAANLQQQPGGPRTSVPEPVNGHAGAVGVHSQVLGGLDHREDHPTPSRRVAAHRTAQLEGLARNDPRGMPVDETIRIHHPGHHLSVGAQVRSGDIAINGQDMLDVLGVAAGHFVKLYLTHRARVALNAALGPAEGDVNQRGLPGHERG